MIQLMRYPGPMSTPWLTEEQLQAWVRLAAVVELLPGALDAELRRDAGLSHFEYYVMAMLSEAPGRTLSMSALAARTNGTLTRLSHVVRRLEDRGLVERFPSTDDGRITLARLTADGWAAVLESAPGHVATVRHLVMDALTPRQVDQLTEITDRILQRLDPDGVMTAPYAGPVRQPEPV